MASYIAPIEQTSTRRIGRKANALLFTLAAIFAVTGSLWIFLARNPNQIAEQTAIQPVPATTLIGPIIATMDSPLFEYSPGWRVTHTGADPSEPAHPWVEPAGIVTFPYRGNELALELAEGAFWGHLFVTVDGTPANLLPDIPGNTNSLGQAAGYKTFYAPESQSGSQPAPRWLPVHRSQTEGESHIARVEIWRSWGQTPLRAVAVDALPVPAMPVWPGLAMLVAAAWLGYLALRTQRKYALFTPSAVARLRETIAPLSLPGLPATTRLFAAGISLLTIAVAVALSSWMLCAAGVLVLAYLAWARPAIWTAVLMFSLPFYYSYALPLLPNRSFGIIDVGVLIGVLIIIANHLLPASEPKSAQSAPRPPKNWPGLRLWFFWLMAAIVSWSLISTFAAGRFDVALYEWRTVFLYAGLFALLLDGSLRRSDSAQTDQWLILLAWLAGSTVVAIYGIWQYLSDTRLITAEGVYRIHAFYGSPNNLALYLERTVVVSLAMALFSAGRVRLAWAMVAIIQTLALVLTFSKGSLFLGLPAALVVLWLGGMVIVRQRGQSRRTLWWIIAIALFALLLLLPFLSAERFQRFLDFSQGTGYLRLQLWRSAWQIALDHPLLGVGPDNFLYEYRSNYLLPEAWQEPNLNHPHNWLLDWWTRLGLPALGLAIAFFAVGTTYLAIQVRHARYLTAQQGALVLGLLAATVAALTHGLIDASYALPDLMLVWVLLLGVGFHYHERI